MTIKVLPTGMHAVLAIDPGGTTGVFAGYVELDPGSLKNTLLSIRRRKAIDVEGDWLTQAYELAALATRFVYTANVENSTPLPNIHIVAEDFVLRMPAVTTNLTSIWVLAGFATVYLSDTIDVHRRHGLPEIDYQQPSEAKSKAKNERLKMWGLWEVGSEHKRDAARHFALKVDKLLLGK